MKYLNHTLIALAVQAIVYLLLGSAVVGAALSIGVFFGREHAQAEYRWIERFGEGKRANWNWKNIFTAKIWSVDSVVWDFLLPAVVVAGIACL